MINYETLKSVNCLAGIVSFDCFFVKAARPKRVTANARAQQLLVQGYVRIIARRLTPLYVPRTVIRTGTTADGDAGKSIHTIFINLFTTVFRNVPSIEIRILLSEK